MKAISYTLIGLSLILILFYVGIQDKAPSTFLFTNLSKNNITVVMSFDKKFYYDGTRIFSDSTRVARLVRKDSANSRLFTQYGKYILNQGKYIFEVRPHEKIILGSGFGKKDLKGIESIQVQDKASVHTYDLSSIEDNLFNGRTQYTFAYK